MEVQVSAPVSIRPVLASSRLDSLSVVVLFTSAQHTTDISKTHGKPAVRGDSGPGERG
jgi:hypothetical protein